MPDEAEVRHDKITVPARLNTGHVKALAMQQAQRKARRRAVVDLQLGDSHAVGSTDDADREWSFSYRLGPQGGRAASASASSWER
ncbi:hypothetical protein A5647_25375 [Mycobacterium sp. 1100029.7]|nr:hypothetical protein A5647_25375 [Mycobacterium sp. 1100029.7]